MALDKFDNVPKFDLTMGQCITVKVNTTRSNVILNLSAPSDFSVVEFTLNSVDGCSSSELFFYPMYNGEVSYDSTYKLQLSMESPKSVFPMYEADIQFFGRVDCTFKLQADIMTVLDSFALDQNGMTNITKVGSHLLVGFVNNVYLDSTKFSLKFTSEQSSLFLNSSIVEFLHESHCLEIRVGEVSPTYTYGMNVVTGVGGNYIIRFETMLMEEDFKNIQVAVKFTELPISLHTMNTNMHSFQQRNNLYVIQVTESGYYRVKDSFCQNFEDFNQELFLYSSNEIVFGCSYGNSPFCASSNVTFQETLMFYVEEEEYIIFDILPFSSTCYYSVNHTETIETSLDLIVGTQTKQLLSIYPGQPSYVNVVLKNPSFDANKHVVLFMFDSVDYFETVNGDGKMIFTLSTDREVITEMEFSHSQQNSQIRMPACKFTKNIRFSIVSNHYDMTSLRLFTSVYRSPTLTNEYQFFTVLNAPNVALNTRFLGVNLDVRTTKLFYLSFLNIEHSLQFDFTGFSHFCVSNRVSDCCGGSIFKVHEISETKSSNLNVRRYFTFKQTSVLDTVIRENSNTMIPFYFTVNTQTIGIKYGIFDFRDYFDYAIVISLKNRKGSEVINLSCGKEGFCDDDGMFIRRIDSIVDSKEHFIQWSLKLKTDGVSTIKSVCTVSLLFTNYDTFDPSILLSPDSVEIHSFLQVTPANDETYVYRSMSGSQLKNYGMLIVKLAPLTDELITENLTLQLEYSLLERPKDSIVVHDDQTEYFELVKVSLDCASRVEIDLCGINDDAEAVDIHFSSPETSWLKSVYFILQEVNFETETTVGTLQNFVNMTTVVIPRRLFSSKDNCKKMFLLRLKKSYLQIISGDGHVSVNTIENWDTRIIATVNVIKPRYIDISETRTVPRIPLSTTSMAFIILNDTNVVKEEFIDAMILFAPLLREGTPSQKLLLYGSTEGFSGPVTKSILPDLAREIDFKSYTSFQLRAKLPYYLTLHYPINYNQPPQEDSFSNLQYTVKYPITLGQVLGMYSSQVSFYMMILLPQIEFNDITVNLSVATSLPTKNNPVSHVDLQPRVKTVTFNTPEMGELSQIRPHPLRFKIRYDVPPIHPEIRLWGSRDSKPLFISTDTNLQWSRFDNSTLLFDVASSSFEPKEHYAISLDAKWSYGTVSITISIVEFLDVSSTSRFSVDMLPYYLRVHYSTFLQIETYVISVEYECKNDGQPLLVSLATSRVYVPNVRVNRLNLMRVACNTSEPITHRFAFVLQDEESNFFYLAFLPSNPSNVTVRFQDSSLFPLTDLAKLSVPSKLTVFQLKDFPRFNGSSFATVPLCISDTSEHWSLVVVLELKNCGIVDQVSEMKLFHTRGGSLDMSDAKWSFTHSTATYDIFPVQNVQNWIYLVRFSVSDEFFEKCSFNAALSSSSFVIEEKSGLGISGIANPDKYTSVVIQTFDTAFNINDVLTTVQYFSNIEDSLPLISFARRAENSLENVSSPHLLLLVTSSQTTMQVPFILKFFGGFEIGQPVTGCSSRLMYMEKIVKVLQSDDIDNVVQISYVSNKILHFEFEFNHAVTSMEIKSNIAFSISTPSQLKHTNGIPNLSLFVCDEPNTLCIFEIGPVLQKMQDGAFLSELVIVHMPTRHQVDHQFQIEVTVTCRSGNVVFTEYNGGGTLPVKYNKQQSFSVELTVSNNHENVMTLNHGTPFFHFPNMMGNAFVHIFKVITVDGRKFVTLEKMNQISKRVLVPYFEKDVYVRREPVMCGFYLDSNAQDTQLSLFLFVSFDHDHDDHVASEFEFGFEVRRANRARLSVETESKYHIPYIMINEFSLSLDMSALHGPGLLCIELASSTTVVLKGLLFASSVNQNTEESTEMEMWERITVFPANERETHKLFITNTAVSLFLLFECPDNTTEYVELDTTIWFEKLDVVRVNNVGRIVSANAKHKLALGIMENLYFENDENVALLQNLFVSNNKISSECKVRVSTNGFLVNQEEHLHSLNIFEKKTGLKRMEILEVDLLNFQIENPLKISTFFSLFNEARFAFVSTYGDCDILARFKPVFTQRIDTNSGVNNIAVGDNFILVHTIMPVIPSTDGSVVLFQVSLKVNATLNTDKAKHSGNFIISPEKKTVQGLIQLYKSKMRIKTTDTYRCLPPINIQENRGVAGCLSLEAKCTLAQAHFSAKDLPPGSDVYILLFGWDESIVSVKVSLKEYFPTSLISSSFEIGEQKAFLLDSLVHDARNFAFRYLTLSPDFGEHAFNYDVSDGRPHAMVEYSKEDQIKKLNAFSFDHNNVVTLWCINEDEESQPVFVTFGQCEGSNNKCPITSSISIFNLAAKQVNIFHFYSMDILVGVRAVKLLKTAILPSDLSVLTVSNSKKSTTNTIKLEYTVDERYDLYMIFLDFNNMERSDDKIDDEDDEYHPFIFLSDSVIGHADINRCKRFNHFSSYIDNDGEGHITSTQRFYVLIKTEVLVRDKEPLLLNVGYLKTFSFRSVIIPMIKQKLAVGVSSHAFPVKMSTSQVGKERLSPTTTQLFYIDLDDVCNEYGCSFDITIVTYGLQLETTLIDDYADNFTIPDSEYKCYTDSSLTCTISYDSCSSLIARDQSEKEFMVVVMLNGSIYYNLVYNVTVDVNTISAPILLYDEQEFTMHIANGRLFLLMQQTAMIFVEDKLNYVESFTSLTATYEARHVNYVEHSGTDFCSVAVMQGQYYVFHMAIKSSKEYKIYVGSVDERFILYDDPAENAKGRYFDHAGYSFIRLETEGKPFRIKVDEHVDYLSIFVGQGSNEELVYRFNMDNRRTLFTMINDSYESFAGFMNQYQMIDVSNHILQSVDIFVVVRSNSPFKMWLVEKDVKEVVKGHFCFDYLPNSDIMYKEKDIVDLYAIVLSFMVHSRRCNWLSQNCKDMLKQYVCLFSKREFSVKVDASDIAVCPNIEVALRIISQGYNITGTLFPDVNKPVGGGYGVYIITTLLLCTVITLGVFHFLKKRKDSED
ncbi:hypothetical protein PCE1_002475 [Barthelona sp. PCE]